MTLKHLKCGPKCVMSIKYPPDIEDMGWGKKVKYLINNSIANTYLKDILKISG